MKLAVRLAAAAVVLLGSSLSYAGKHPVPLEKNTDSAKCIECHEDKSKGKVVHSAIPMGCTSCHEVRVNKEVTRIKLTTTTPVALCITCHADKNASDIKGKVHVPAIRDCLKCHDAHTSENKNQLLKATSGPKDANLCLSCHKTGENVPASGSRHAALDMGCDTCHVTHKTGERGKREFDFHLTKDTPGLCIDCHDVKDAALAKTHNDQPIANTNCLSCHDPHQSNGKKLVQKFPHSVFGDKDSCSTCHAAPKDGKITLTQADSKSLCLTCHEDKAKLIETAKVPHAGAMGDCIDCHSPHASKTPGLPKTDGVSTCLSCHADQAEQHKKKNLHQPAFQQGCGTCHAPHGGENPKLLRAATPNKLCLECHGPDAKATKVEGQPLATIFDGKVKLPENYLGRVTRLPIKYGLGHPVGKHPVVDQMDPTDVTKVRVPINCASCHQPHASKEPGLLVGDQKNDISFCAKCHKNLGE